MSKSCFILNYKRISRDVAPSGICGAKMVELGFTKAVLALESGDLTHVYPAKLNFVLNGIEEFEGLEFGKLYTIEVKEVKE